MAPKTFVNYCMGCHGAKFQRYERVANDLGISEELMMNNLVLTGAKFGDHMQSSMTADDAEKMVRCGAARFNFGCACAQGADWLYTYMRTFYEDPTRPYGVNNKVFPSVGMPNVLVRLPRHHPNCLVKTKLQIEENGAQFLIS